MSFKELIDELEEIIEDANAIPLSGGKAIISKDEIFGIIEQIRLAYPNDIKEAEYVRKERDRILADAEKEAKILTDEAKNKVARMVDDSEIVRLAKQKASEIIEETQAKAREMHNDAVARTNAYEDQRKADLQRYQDSVIKYSLSSLQKAESTTEAGLATVKKAMDELTRQYESMSKLYETILISKSKIGE
ncbi:MAG: hypothetical protein E7411_05155 [Ruminococcaceae bacterium]|nr:hypothetical protein [Oscillospiraceae bacterium]